MARNLRLIESLWRYGIGGNLARFGCNLTRSIYISVRPHERNRREVFHERVHFISSIAFVSVLVLLFDSTGVRPSQRRAVRAGGVSEWWKDCSRGHLQSGPKGIRQVHHCCCTGARDGIVLVLRTSHVPRLLPRGAGLYSPGLQRRPFRRNFPDVGI